MEISIAKCLISILAIHLVIVLLLKLFGKKQKSLMVLFGSGGHTIEMIYMLSHVNFKRFNSIYFVCAGTDTYSKNKVINDFSEKGIVCL